jgi:two-component system, OmpR family, response regulator
VSATPLVLVVDDEEMVRENLGAYLDDEGFAVVLAGSAEQGLTQLAEHDCDVAVVDMRLPGMNGNRFIQEAHAARPRLRFLVHTGSLNYVPPAEFAELGIGGGRVFIKPVPDMSVIAEAIRQIVAQEARE